MNKKIVGIIGICVLLSGCAAMLPYDELKKPQYRDTRRHFTAEVPEEWMRYNGDKDFMMTRDGLSLERIVVSRREVKDKLKFTKKKFEQTMTPQELAEVQVDDLRSNQELGQFELKLNKPATLAGEQQGFHLEYAYRTPDGLSRSGVRYGFLNGEWMYLILYDAPRQYYFEQYQRDFQKFIETFRIF